MTRHQWQWVDVETITTPRNGTLTFVGYWWVTNAEGQVCIYRRYYPQANQNPDIVDKLMPRVPGAVGKVFVPVAYLSQHPQEAGQWP